MMIPRAIILRSSSHTSFELTHVCLYMLVFTCCRVCIGERMPSDNKLDCPTREEVLILIQIRKEKETDKVKGILGNPSRVKYHVSFHFY